MYQVLYRKWRSPTFGDVVGQDHVTTTLRRALQAQRLAHAYLFTGPRGTGKTSCARILAKAVNCTNPQEGEPCNTCELCMGIDNNSILDVIEIDAASNNGVDNIRDLRDETNFTPTHGKYRVYIIDEVHMLSAGAFNALLKTLEEPPSYVIFILATTEVHKLPATVLSRCQRFDFHRISAEDIAKRLLRVTEQEGLALEEGAAMLLARVADGAMRDAYSLLDRCRTEGENITTASVARAIGMADRRYLFELCDALLTCDIGACLQLIHQLYHDACEMERLCEELLVHMRNLLVLRSVKTPREFLLCTDEDLALYQAQAKLCTVPQLLKYMEVLEQTQQNLRRSTDRRMEMELGLIRLCTMGQTPTVAPTVRQLPQGGALGKDATPAKPQPSSEQVPASYETPAAAKEETPGGFASAPTESAQPKPPEQPSLREPSSVRPEGGQLLPEEGAKALAASDSTPSPDHATGDRLFAEWGMVLAKLGETNPGLAGILQGSSAVTRGEHILIKSTNPAFEAFIRQPNQAGSLKQAIYDVSDRKVKLGIFKGDAAPPKDPLAELAARAEKL
ncbi:MAG: DNA polymerase III subunit gamma/tau [Oscillospiraceae bacterium]|nr:DNA polymerase III subunit gamma/tau [Oscillospiraceae bacterium]